MGKLEKSKKSKLPPLSLAAAAHLARLEQTKKTPGEWLEWAVEVTEAPPPRDEQAWESLRWLVQGFSQGGLAHVAVERHQPPAVSKAEAKRIVGRLDDVMRQMAEKQPTVVLGHFRTRRELTWNPQEACYEVEDVPLGGAGWEAQALAQFGRLIAEFAHHGLSECPADAPRERKSGGKWKGKGKCERRFLVRRAGQRFCSATCQTRMKVRGLRAQQGKKVSKPGKTSKKGKHAAA